jgi:hypothetical protein
MHSANAPVSVFKAVLAVIALVLKKLGGLFTKKSCCS